MDGLHPYLFMACVVLSRHLSPLSVCREGHRRLFHRLWDAQGAKHEARMVSEEICDSPARVCGWRDSKSNKWN